LRSITWPTSRRPTTCPPRCPVPRPSPTSLVQRADPHVRHCLSGLELTTDRADGTTRRVLPSQELGPMLGVGVRDSPHRLPDRALEGLPVGDPGSIGVT
jgi:hypothetical protein